LILHGRDASIKGILYRERAFSAENENFEAKRALLELALATEISRLAGSCD
jgi:hypothetical protein